MSREFFISALAGTRQRLDGPEFRRLALKDQSGLLLGLFSRESTVLAHLSGESLGSIAPLANSLPTPFWTGIHPLVEEKLWHESALSGGKERLGREVRRAVRTKIVEVEPGVDKNSMNAQVHLLEELLPSGSLWGVFFTKGTRSIWKSVPLVNAFCANAHQMSLPDIVGRNMGGFNMVLLTDNRSELYPEEWEKPFLFNFKGCQGEVDPTNLWIVLHQVGHCLVLPTCWEYIDRTYSLISAEELVKLTEMRLRCLNMWLLDYYQLNGRSYNPDSASFLYEVKVAERALMTAKHYRLDPLAPGDLNLDELYWFRGLHLERLSRMMGVEKGLLLAGVMKMDGYLVSNHTTPPTDGWQNSVCFSTDIGTHPLEEVVVDMLMKRRCGVLPGRYQYWNEYLEMVLGFWKRWDSTFEF